jgi:DNA-binding NarL/FixJ family response regulator
MYGTADRLFPVLMLSRNGSIGELPPGVLMDLHAGIVCALAVCADYDGLGDYGREARRIVGLITPDGTREERARDILSTDAGIAETVVASTVLSNLAWAAGNLDDGLRRGRSAVELTNRGVPESWRPYPYLALAEKLIDIGELNEAEILIKAADREIAKREEHPASVDVEISRGRLLYTLSDFPAARRKLCATVERATKEGADWTTRYGLLLLALTDLRRPDLRAACDSMWKCRAEFTGDPLALPSLQYRWGEYLVSTIGLSPQRAVEMFTEEYSDLLSSPALFVMDAAAAPWLVRLAQTANDVLLATSVVAAVETLAAANAAYPTVAATALHARAILGNDAEALRAASSAHRDVWAGRLAAEHLRSLDHQEEAACGVASESATGTTPPPPAPEFQARASGTLTTTEQRIAHLVSCGMTNQQIAHSLRRSPHTVNYHLRRIFEKLKIRSRVELATYCLRENT